MTQAPNSWNGIRRPTGRNTEQSYFYQKGGYLGNRHSTSKSRALHIYISLKILEHLESRVQGRRAPFPFDVFHVRTARTAGLVVFF